MNSEIQKAAALIRAGKLVAFPTETVYGLGANALDAAAVDRIYAAKGRPNTSPVIVHASSIAMVRTLVAAWPPAAQELADAFWPGPLTIILPKLPIVPSNVTAGLETVGIRMPAHPLAQELIQAADVPIAAPSANRFTELSPTTAEHVRRSLGDRVDFILDGGACKVGIESTVISLVEATPVLLRPGGISREQIESLIGPVATASSATSGAHASPGLHPRHYSPRTPLLIAREGAVPSTGLGAYLQHKNPARNQVKKIIRMPQDARGYAAQLYDVLHNLDEGNYDWIAVEEVPESPEWEAIRDRLKRASSD